MKQFVDRLTEKLRTAIQWFTDWYWNIPLRQQRRIVEEDARRLGGRVVWDEQGRAP